MFSSPWVIRKKVVKGFTTKAANDDAEDTIHANRETNSNNVESVLLTIDNKKPPSEITNDSDEV